MLMSIDWHQVLDVCRTRAGDIRPSQPYTLIARYKGKLIQVKAFDPRILLVINSYTCVPYYRDSVHGLAQTYPGLFDHIITTSDRTSRGGKAHTLGTFISYKHCVIIHFDDQKDILNEFANFRQYRLDQGLRVELKPVGITVPRRAKASGIRYFRNLEEALDQLDLKHLLGRIPPQ
eukprot:Skav217268  [mRNA]  locus=scaffold47:1631308:1631835:- [translate_table: standard]